MSKKRAGDELRMETDGEKELRIKAASRLVGLARKNMHQWPGDRTKRILASMIHQFDVKGSLSDKQVGYLRFIVEQLPHSLLEESE